MPESKNNRPSSRRAVAPKKPKTKPDDANSESCTVMEESYEARNARLAATLDLTDISDPERAFLATCQRIYHRDRGSVTPFEHFFWSLVFSVQHDNWPTPDDVEQGLGTFKDDFEDMDKWARVFVDSYPTPVEQQVTSEPPQAPEVAKPTRKGTTGHSRARKPRKAVARG